MRGGGSERREKGGREGEGGWVRGREGDREEGKKNMEGERGSE